MITKCAVLAAVLLLVAVVYLLEQLAFLRPYRWLLLQRYGWTIAGFLAVLFLNLFALVYLVSRRLLLNDTGRKLAHLDKEIRTHEAIVRDLSERLAREE